MSANIKKIIISLLVILVSGGGIIAGLVLVRQKQELREKAAVPGGQAEVSLFPTTGSFDVGDTFPVSVYFNTANIAISGVSVRLTYSYFGATPEFVASNIEINSVLLSSGDWTCPTRNVTAEAGKANIDIACANISAAGFSTSSDTLLATFDFAVERTPAVDPVVVRFDPSMSVITQKSDGQDILLIPTSTGEYSVAGVTATATPIPTGAVISATPTVTPTGTTTPTATPTLTTTATPTATGAAQLPDAGVSYPTVVGIGLGILVIVGAFILAL